MEIANGFLGLGSYVFHKLISVVDCMEKMKQMIGMTKLTYGWLKLYPRHFSCAVLNNDKYFLKNLYYEGIINKKQKSVLDKTISIDCHKIKGKDNSGYLCGVVLTVDKKPIKQGIWKCTIKLNDFDDFELGLVHPLSLRSLGALDPMCFCITSYSFYTAIGGFADLPGYDKFISVEGYEEFILKKPWFRNGDSIAIEIDMNKKKAFFFINGKPLEYAVRNVIPELYFRLKVTGEVEFISLRQLTASSIPLHLLVSTPEEERKEREKEEMLRMKRERRSTKAVQKAVRKEEGKEKKAKDKDRRKAKGDERGSGEDEEEEEGRDDEGEEVEKDKDEDEDEGEDSSLFESSNDDKDETGEETAAALDDRLSFTFNPFFCYRDNVDESDEEVDERSADEKDDAWERRRMERRRRRREARKEKEKKKEKEKEEKEKLLRRVKSSAKVKTTSTTTTTSSSFTSSAVSVSFSSSSPSFSSSPSSFSSSSQRRPSLSSISPIGLRSSCFSSSPSFSSSSSSFSSSSSSSPKSLSSSITPFFTATPSQCCVSVC